MQDGIFTSTPEFAHCPVLWSSGEDAILAGPFEVAVDRDAPANSSRLAWSGL